MRKIILLSIFLATHAGLLSPLPQAWPADPTTAAGIRVGSLEWQKIDLEAKLQDRIHQSILKIIPEKYFNIGVSITLKKITPPTPKPTESEPTPESEKNDTQDRRISLGKLDFDAPVLNEHEDDSFLDSFGERKKLKVINLFDQIERVNIAVLIDNTVQDTKKELITKLVKGATSALGEDIVNTSIEKAEIYSPKQFEEPWDIPRWITELKIPFAIVFATLIVASFLSFVLLLVSRGYFKIESRRTAILEAKNAREAAAEEAKMNPAFATAGPTSSPTGGASSSPGDSADPSTDQTENGFDRFKAILAENPEKMSDLIRQWVKSPGRGATEALVILPRVLSTAECLQLFKHLKEQDRRDWKKVLSTPTDERSYKIAENFISFQIVDSLLVPPSTTDEELQRMLSSLSLADCIEIASSNVNLGALLIDLLPTAQAGRLYSLMNRELADSLATAAMKVSDREIASQSNALKQAIKNIMNKKKSVPFLDRAADLVNSVGQDREETILKTLAEAGEFQLLEATAKQFFPSELVMRLPGPALKTCLERYPVARRAEIILSRAENEKTTLLSSIGGPDSRARELLDIEVQNIEVDDVRKKRIEKSKNLIWRDFISTVRTVVKTDDTVAELSKDILSDWLGEKTAGQYRGSDADNSA